MTVHRFADSCRVEERWAPVLDAWLRQHYHVREATANEQWQGVDRVLTRPDGTTTAVDYKVDARSATTGNYFVETVSNDRTSRPGWAMHGGEGFVLFFTPPSEVIVVARERLKVAVARWRMAYPEKSAQNDGYRTLGLCVPVADVVEVSEYQASLSEAPVMERRDHD